MRTLSKKAQLSLAPAALAAYSQSVAEFQVKFDTQFPNGMPFSADISKLGKPFTDAEGNENGTVVVDANDITCAVGYADAVPVVQVLRIGQLDVIASELGCAGYRHLRLVTTSCIEVGTISGTIQLTKAGDSYIDKDGKAVLYKTTCFRVIDLAIRPSKTVTKRLAQGSANAVDAGFMSMLGVSAKPVSIKSDDDSNDEADL